MKPFLEALAPSVFPKMPRKKKRHLFFWTLVFPGLLLVAFVVGCNLWIVGSTHNRVYGSPSEIDGMPVALVLGTSKNVAPDTPNQHFVNRIAAAADLYREGKVEQLLVSGHRDSRYYDETLDMIAKLQESGVPEHFILADDRGARTLDSVVRARSVFGFEQIVIISDDFHVARALFIADRLGLEAVALKSESVHYEDSARVRMREYFARVKAILDLYFFERSETVAIAKMARTTNAVPLPRSKS